VKRLEFSTPLHCRVLEARIKSLGATGLSTRSLHSAVAVAPAPVGMTRSSVRGGLRRAVPHPSRAFREGWAALRSHYEVERVRDKAHRQHSHPRSVRIIVGRTGYQCIRVRLLPIKTKLSPVRFPASFTRKPCGGSRRARRILTGERNDIGNETNPIECSSIKRHDAGRRPGQEGRPGY